MRSMEGEKGRHEVDGGERQLLDLADGLHLGGERDVIVVHFL